MTNDLRHLRTGRLQLDAVTDADLEPMYALHADPAVWGHFPAGRHLHRDTTRTFIAGIQQSWNDDGLGYWAARAPGCFLSPPGDEDGLSFAGVGGCARRFGIVWNIYYRLTPRAWGHGFAGEIASAARSAAARVDPDLPVVAYLLEHNLASKRTAERAGLTFAWSGPDHGNPDPTAIRLLYSDRPVASDLIEYLAGQS